MGDYCIHEGPEVRKYSSYMLSMRMFLSHNQNQNLKIRIRNLVRQTVSKKPETERKRHLHALRVVVPITKQPSFRVGQVAPVACQPWPQSHRGCLVLPRARVRSAFGESERKSSRGLVARVEECLRDSVAVLNPREPGDENGSNSVVPRGCYHWSLPYKSLRQMSLA